MNPLGPFGTGFTDRGAFLNALNSQLRWYRGRDSNSQAREAADFESAVYAIPPPRLVVVVGINPSLDFMARKHSKANNDYYKPYPFNHFNHFCHFSSW